MLNNLASLFTILGGGIFFLLGIYAILDYGLSDDFGGTVKVIMVLASLVLSVCSIFTGLKLFLM